MQPNPKKAANYRELRRRMEPDSRLEQREWRENPPRRRAAHQTAACHFNIRAVRARIAPSRPSDCKERLYQALRPWLCRTVKDIRPMQIIATAIPDVKEIRPVRRLDPRGFFSEIFREELLREHGIDVPFVQENHSLSVDRGVVRGLHFQTPPAGQAKLVRV